MSRTNVEAVSSVQPPSSTCIHYLGPCAALPPVQLDIYRINEDVVFSVDIQEKAGGQWRPYQ